MKKTRIVIGLAALSLVLTVAVAVSCVIVNDFSETKVISEITSQPDNEENVVKSGNKTEKLSLKVSKTNTKREKLKSRKKQSLVIDTNKKTADIKKKKPQKNKLKSIGTYRITGYCSCASCCGKTNGVTASGTYATAGRTVAADTSKLPFGTKVVIEGHTYTVEDVGGAVNGNHIDVFFSSHSKALEWGVRYCEVYVTQ
jgi:3D (Asp-Asp-Asp) domain-containing protein